MREARARFLACALVGAALGCGGGPPAPAARPAASAPVASSAIAALYRDGAVIADAQGRTAVRDRIDWEASYVIILEPGASAATLHGRLAVSNRSNEPLRAGTAHAVSGRLGALRRPAPAPDLADGDGDEDEWDEGDEDEWDEGDVDGEAGGVNGADEIEAGEASSPTGAARSAPEQSVPLPGGIELPPGGVRAIELFGGGRRVPARVRLFFDPIGDALDRPRRVPERRRDYGVGAAGPVSFEVSLEVGAGELRRVLPGSVQVLQRRADGGLEPLGRSWIGGDATAATVSGDGPAAAADDRLEVNLGRAAHVRAVRRRTDFHLDAAARRLVEEVRIELDNRAGTAVEVVVAEHLYRGLNWTIAYFNDAGTISKEGPQLVHILVPVPPRGRATAMYRVVYTW